MSGASPRTSDAHWGPAQRSISLRRTAVGPFDESQAISLTGEPEEARAAGQGRGDPPGDGPVPSDRTSPRAGLGAQGAAGRAAAVARRRGDGASVHGADLPGRLGGRVDRDRLSGRRPGSSRSIVARFMGAAARPCPLEMQAKDRPWPGEYLATVGVFDGFHLGHQAILAPMLAASRQSWTSCTLVTFHPRPVTVFAPETPPDELTPAPRKWRLLAEAGIDRVAVLRFSREFAQIEPEDFLTQVLGAGNGLRGIWIGYDFRFGHRRRGGLGDACRGGKEARLRGASRGSRRVRRRAGQLEPHSPSACARAGSRKRDSLLGPVARHRGERRFRPRTGREAPGRDGESLSGGGAVPSRPRECMRERPSGTGRTVRPS